MYARLGTKDATRRRSGSEGRCGKRESELDGDWVRGIGVAQAVDSLNSGLVQLGGAAIYLAQLTHKLIGVYLAKSSEARVSSHQYRRRCI